MAKPKTTRTHQCMELTRQGRVCGKVFSRPWNLRRHLTTQHREHRTGGVAFVAHDFSPSLPFGEGTVSGATLPRPPVPVIFDLPSSLSNKQEIAGTLARSCPPEPRQGLGPLPLVPTRVPRPLATPDPGTLKKAPGSIWTTEDLPSSSTSKRGSGMHALDHDIELAAQKRRWLGRSRFQEIMPDYDVKLSRKHTDQPQQRAVEWLTGAAKSGFEHHITDIMQRWGLKRSHSGTCVVWPRDWAALEVEEIAQMLTSQNYPLVDSELAGFRFSDHITSLARAAAWFCQWPRTGIQLDNFLECGPFQRRDASHLCHTPLCVNPWHICYEPSDMNQSRRDCQEHARFLRADRRPVPPTCSKHDPPCMMQHTALSIYERCLIQVSLWRLANNLLPREPPPRPRWHRFPTFETCLPLLFVKDSALRCAPEDRAQTPVPGKIRPPPLICRYCPRIKAFHGVAAYWSHLVHKHKSEDEDSKLQEVRRTAALWLSYWEAKGITTTSPDATGRRLVQVANSGFSWSQVEDWGLQ